MKNPRLTLNDIKNSLEEPAKVREHRVSDFLTPEEMRQLRAAHLHRNKPKFDKVDALEAEIIARFGWPVYERWCDEEISTKQLVKWINAERGREAARLGELEAALLACAAGTVSKKPRKCFMVAQKFIQTNEKIQKGAN
jgi:hypothetical protein